MRLTLSSWRYGISLLACYSLLHAAGRTAGQTFQATERPVQVSGGNMDTTEIKSLIDTAWSIANTQPDNALQILGQTLQESQGAGYAWGIAKSLQLSGIICSHTGRFERGIAYLRRLIYYCLVTGNQTNLLALGYNIIGNIYQGQGKYREAAYYYHQALLMPKEYVKESTTGLIYTNLSRLTHKLKQPAKALYYLDRAARIAVRNDNYDLLCIIHSNRGMIYTDMARPDSARYFFRKAMALIKAHHSLRYDLLDIEYTNMTYMADLWLSEGRPDSAAPCIRRMQEIQAPIVPLYRNKAYLTTGKFYLASGDYKKAEHYLLVALDSAQTIHIGNDLTNIHLTLADLYTITGRYRQALWHKDRYIRLKDSLESETVASNVHQLEVRYRTAEKDKQLISQKLEISRQQHDMREKNLWIIVIASGMVVLVIVSAALYKKRQADRRLQQKEIQILRQQQEAMRQGQEIERLKAMMKGEERERGRLARELHDGIGGMLTAIKMNLSAARKKYPELSGFGALTEITHMLEDTGTEIRKTAHNLMPDVLVHNSLPEALMIYCEHITTNDQLQIDLQFHGALEQLSKATELMLYRMIQELLQNIAKHACASYAVVQLREHEGTLSLTVEDNGGGFDTAAHNGGFGLQNLKYRVAALQGHISIMSAKGRSTTVHIGFELEKLKLAEG